MSLESLGSFYAMGRSVRVDTGKVNGKYTETLTGTDDEQKAYLTAGFCAMAAINAGVSAVGQLLTMNDVDDKGVTNEKLEQIGFLIVNLGELGYAINNDIQYATHVRVNGGSIVHD
jgi:hypothetical protein